MINRAITKICNVLSTDDTGSFRYAVVSWLGKKQKGQAFSPYGLCTNPPDSSMAVGINLQGISSNLLLFIDDPKNRLKDLEKGEVAIVNYLTQSRIHCKMDGEIDILSNSGARIRLLADGTLLVSGDTVFENNVTFNKSMSVLNEDNDQTASFVGNVELTGNIQVDGNIQADGNIHANGTITSDL